MNRTTRFNFMAVFVIALVMALFPVFADAHPPASAQNDPPDVAAVATRVNTAESAVYTAEQPSGRQARNFVEAVYTTVVANYDDGVLVADRTGSRGRAKSRTVSGSSIFIGNKQSTLTEKERPRAVNQPTDAECETSRLNPADTPTRPPMSDRQVKK